MKKSKIRCKLVFCKLNKKRSIKRKVSFPVILATGIRIPKFVSRIPMTPFPSVSIGETIMEKTMTLLYKNKVTVDLAML
jgi:hypothetical protein